MKEYIFPKVYLAFISALTVISTRQYNKVMNEDYETRLKTRNL